MVRGQNTLCRECLNPRKVQKSNVPLLNNVEYHSVICVFSLNSLKVQLKVTIICNYELMT